MNRHFAEFFTWRNLLKRLFNMGCFYGGWLICMHEATGPTPFFGPFVVAMLLIYQMFLTTVFWVDAILVVSLALVGTIVDSLYIWIGLIEFKGGYACCPHIAPLWITSLWALYASSINHSLDWLRWHIILIAAPTGAAGAISSYLVGIQLGAATSHYSPTVTFGVIGLVWAIVVPVSLMYSKWLKTQFTEAS